MYSRFAMSNKYGFFKNKDLLLPRSLFGVRQKRRGIGVGKMAGFLRPSFNAKNVRGRQKR